MQLQRYALKSVMKLEYQYKIIKWNFKTRTQNTKSCQSVKIQPELEPEFHLYLEIQS